jgi:hypothetical protein
MNKEQWLQWLKDATFCGLYPEDLFDEAIKVAEQAWEFAYDEELGTRSIKQATKVMHPWYLERLPDGCFTQLTMEEHNARNRANPNLNAEFKAKHNWAGL